MLSEHYTTKPIALLWLNFQSVFTYKKLLSRAGTRLAEGYVAARRLDFVTVRR